MQRVRSGGVESVWLMGGEPTLREDLAALVRKLRAAGGASALLQTNGRRLAYMAYTRELAEAGLSAVEISLPGARQEVHDYHTRVPGSFEQSVQGIRNARSAGLRVGMTAVVTRSSFRHLQEQAALAARLGAEALHFALARPWGEAREQLQRIVPRWTAVLPYLDAAARWSRRSGLSLLVSGLPPCLVSGIDAHPLEAELPGAFPPGRFFEEVCGSCDLRSRCGGVDEVYAERYGIGELRLPNRGASADSVALGRAPSAAVTLFAGAGVIESYE